MTVASTINLNYAACSSVALACGLYYKHITIIIDAASVVSDAPNCSITYDRRH